MANADNTFLEYLLLYKLNFANWRIVDVDHYMKGNTYFNKLLSEEDFNKQFEDELGEGEILQKIKQKDVEFDKFLNAFNKYLEKKEPMSNIKLMK